METINGNLVIHYLTLKTEKEKEKSYVFPCYRYVHANNL